MIITYFGVGIWELGISEVGVHPSWGISPMPTGALKIKT